ncbi:MAG: transporter [Candidatus Eisenbacteria bacterium]
MAAATLVAAFASCDPASAQDSGSSTAAEQQKVAKDLSNPVADMASIPLQFNWESGVGDPQDLRLILNIQPVVPFSLNSNWVLVGRFIMPYMNQPAGLMGETASGTGDIIASAFFTPKRSPVVCGFGPVFGLPTTTNPLLGSGKWMMGPTAVVLKQKGPLSIGFLGNHLWSISDTGDIERKDVSQTFLQPFLTFTTRTAWTFGINTESTYDWKAPDGEEWTVPIHAWVSKVTRMGPFPFSVALGGGYFVESPDMGADWKLRTAFTLILPKGKS